MRRIFRTTLTYFFLLFAMVSWTVTTQSKEKAHASRRANQSAHQKCSKKELALKNCSLNFRNYKISFWSDKFSVSNGISRSLVDLPLVHEKSEWDNVRILQFGANILVEFIAWQEPDATGIQTKRWFVYELKDEKADLKLDKALWKRLISLDEKEKTKSKTDKEKKFGLRLNKKKIEWFLDREKGHIE